MMRNCLIIIMLLTLINFAPMIRNFISKENKTECIKLPANTGNINFKNNYYTIFPQTNFVAIGYSHNYPSNCIAIGHGAFPTCSWEIVVTFTDGTEWRTNFPHKIINLRDGYIINEKE